MMRILGKGREEMYFCDAVGGDSMYVETVRSVGHQWNSSRLKVYWKRILAAEAAKEGG